MCSENEINKDKQNTYMKLLKAQIDAIGCEQFIEKIKDIINVYQDIHNYDEAQQYLVWYLITELRKEYNT